MLKALFGRNNGKSTIARLNRQEELIRRVVEDRGMYALETSLVNDLLRHLNAKCGTCSSCKCGKNKK